MNPKLTPEIETALKQIPFGPIRLDCGPGAEPVYLIRLDDIAGLQLLVDNRVKDKLLEADRDVVAGEVEDWDAESTKLRARYRMEQDPRQWER